MDAWINPVTRDYVADPVAVGALQRDPAAGLANACYIRLMTPLGTWFGDATLGSRLHELQREKDVPRVALLAKQYAEMALQPILDDGRAQQIEVTTQRAKDDTNSGRLLLAIRVVDAHGQEKIFQYPVKVV